MASITEGCEMYPGIGQVVSCFTSPSGPVFESHEVTPWTCSPTQATDSVSTAVTCTHDVRLSVSSKPSQFLDTRLLEYGRDIASHHIACRGSEFWKVRQGVD